MFLVLLCIIFVLFLAFFIYQKWKGDCSKCNTLQQTVDKYVTGQLNPITKQTCKDRDAYFAEQSSKKEMEEAKNKGLMADREKAWNLGFNATPEDSHSVHILQPPVAPQAPTVVPETGSNKARFSLSASPELAPEDNAGFARNSAGSYANSIPCSSVYSQYNGEGLQNPYLMKGIPNGADQSRMFATYDYHNSEDARSKQDGKRASAGDEEKANKHRSGAYGRFTPLPSPARVFKDVDLESQEEKKRPAWKVWQSKE